MLEFIDLKENKSCKKQVKKLYNDAFPRIERVPFFILNLLIKNDIKFYGIYENKEFIGLTYIVVYKDIAFIFYLAINPKLRGKGYGSSVLESIKEQYSDYRIILNIEELDKNSENYNERLKRKEFYKKNGFYDLNYTVTEVGVDYEMLCYNKNQKIVTKQEYMELMKYYFGNFLFNNIYKKYDK